MAGRPCSSVAAAASPATALRRGRRRPDRSASAAAPPSPRGDRSRRCDRRRLRDGGGGKPETTRTAAACNIVIVAATTAAVAAVEVAASVMIAVPAFVGACGRRESRCPRRQCPYVTRRGDRAATAEWARWSFFPRGPNEVVGGESARWNGGEYASGVVCRVLRVGRSCGLFLVVFHQSIVNNEMLSPYSRHVARRVPLST